MSLRVAVVGGGIAGLAAGYHLVRAGVRDVVLYEREPVLFALSSGRNAGIYRPLELDDEVTSLVARSANALDQLLGSRSGWLEQRGLHFVAREAPPITSLVAAASRTGVPLDVLDQRELVRAVPLLRDGQARFGALVPGAGYLDTHAVSAALSRWFRAGGGAIRHGEDVVRIEERKGRVSAVATAAGEHRACDAVVVAGGAWAVELGRTCGAAIPISILRRHLVLLGAVEPAPTSTVWDVEQELYFRPESGLVLASPGDALRLAAPDYRASSRALRLLVEKANAVAPALARAEVHRFWACLRVLAPDGRPIIGEDCRVAGLHWLAALGGSGMSAGVAAGEVLARSVLGVSRVGDDVFSPRRFRDGQG